MRNCGPFWSDPEKGKQFITMVPVPRVHHLRANKWWSLHLGPGLLVPRSVLFTWLTVRPGEEPKLRIPLLGHCSLGIKIHTKDFI